MSASSRAGVMPVILPIRHLTIAFDDVVICRDLDVDVCAHRGLGVVGENGAGKSCVLRAMAETAARDGVVAVLVPQGDERSAFLSQLDPRQAARFGVIDDLALALGAPEGGAARWQSASPGQRRRALLAAALSASPDVLLLDEPTNHLDDDAREVLIGALRGFRGAVVVASHDRVLLDALCQHTLVLHRGEHLVVDAGVDVALATFERTLQGRRDQRHRALAAVDDARHKLGAARTTASHVQHQKKTKTRMKGPKDHDARGMLQKGRVIAAEHKAGRTVEVRRRALERAEEAVDDVVGAPKQLGRTFFVGHQPARQRLVASWHGALLAGDFQVRDRVDVDVGRTDRVRLVGRNGAGKTTLLSALWRSSPVVDDALLLPQTIEDSVAALHAVRDLPRDVRGRALQAVAALGVDPERVLPSASPSMGEAKKLTLAVAFANDTPVLFLDEPTNHLDLPSVGRLASALSAFPGAVVLITHDDSFAAAAGVWQTFDVETGRRGGGGAL